MYLLITNYGWGEKRIDRAATLAELMTLYRDSSSPPSDLIIAKELTLTFIEPIDPSAPPALEAMDDAEAKNPSPS